MPLAQFISGILLFTIIASALLAWAARTGGHRRLWTVAVAIVLVIAVASALQALIRGPYTLPLRALLISFVPWLGVPVLAAAGGLHILHVRRVTPLALWFSAFLIALVTLPLGLSLTLFLSDMW